MENNNNEKQFLALIHVFMCNSALCVYNSRNPSQISDIMDDEKDWFENKIPKIQSIVRKVSSKFSHGWIRIDVILTNPDTPIERWYFINTPVPGNKKPRMTDQLKYKTYHEIALYIRSMFTFLNCMPSKTLALSLERMTDPKREIKIELVPLSEFPVDEPDVPNAATLAMKELVTPLGACSVRCVYNTKPELLLPQIMEKVKREESEESLRRSEYKVPEKSKDILNDSCEELNRMIDSLTKTESAETIVGEIVPMTIDEFAKLVGNTKFEDKKKTKDEIVQQFNRIKVETSELLANWSRSG
jgi:hypothetical protein